VNDRSMVGLGGKSRRSCGEIGPKCLVWRAEVTLREPQGDRFTVFTDPRNKQADKFSEAIRFICEPALLG